MLSLVLVAALCGAGGCDYLDVTGRFPEVTDNESCFATAVSLNEQNAGMGEDPRFACLEPATFVRLSHKPEL